MEGHRHGHGHVGFRFHPTEEEIITYFLEKKMCGLDLPVRTIEDIVDVCMYEPWDLPQRSPMPKEDRVWYFFNAPVSKYANSKRINRTTRSGFWKVTGRDRGIWDTQGKQIGFKKNLVFYEGRVPNGIRTHWVIHEYHSHNAASYPKEYVLFRLKRKSGDKPDTCSELIRHLPSDSVNRATGNTNTQMNSGMSQELLLPDNTPLTEGNMPAQAWLVSRVQQERGTSLYFDRFNKIHNDSFFQTSEQEDDFVNSLWADDVECFGQISVNTLPHDFNPTKPLSRVYVGDSSDTDTELCPKPSRGLQASGFVYKNTSSKGYSEMPLFRALNESSSSSNGDAIIELDISSVNSDTDFPVIFRGERVVDKFPINTRIRKAQHTPKFHKRFEAQYYTRQIQGGEDAENAVDLSRAENSTVKFGKDEQMAQARSARTSSKSSSSSNRSGCSNRNGSFISWETPLLSHKTNPPSVYLFNVLVSLVLLIFIIREMAYLH